MKYPKSIQNLIDHFTRLPSVGPKTAERYVFFLLRQSGNKLQSFAQAMAELKENIQICKKCNSVSESSPCFICSDKKRDQSTVCVTANTREMLTIEATGQYNGLFHILGGLINTIEGVKPESLNIKNLINRTKKEKIKEIIIALSPNLEGETTAMYIAKLLKPSKIKISRIAKGLPAGANLEYADEMTLSNALKYRNTL